MFKIARCPVHGAFSHRIAKGERLGINAQNQCPKCSDERLQAAHLQTPSKEGLEWTIMPIDPKSEEDPISIKTTPCCGVRVTGAFGKGLFEGEILGVCDVCKHIVARYNPVKKTLMYVASKESVQVGAS